MATGFSSFGQPPLNSSFGQPPSPSTKALTGLGGPNPFTTNNKSSILAIPTTPTTKAKATTGQSPTTGFTNFAPGAGTSNPFNGIGFLPPSTSSNTQATTTGFGASFPTTSFTAGLPGSTPAPNPVIIQQPKHAILNTKFKDLEGTEKGTEGKEAAKMIRETYEKFKLPMKEGLSELEKTKELADLTLVEKELRKLRLVVLKLENDHLIQCKKVAELREESHEQFQHARRFGRSSLEQMMKKRMGQGGMRGTHYGQFDYTQDEIPNAFYVSALKKLEKRLALCTEDVRQFSLQLNVSIDNMSNHANTYGHRMNVGPKQIVKILQHQNEMFGKVSSNIASLHKEVEIIKAEFLRSTGCNPNIFKGQTFEEKKSKEIMDKLLAKEAEDKSKKAAQQQQQQQPQQQQQQQQQQPFAISFPSLPATAQQQIPQPGAGGGLGNLSTTINNPFSTFQVNPLGGAGFGIQNINKKTSMDDSNLKLTKTKGSKK